MAELKLSRQQVRKARRSGRKAGARTSQIMKVNERLAQLAELQASRAAAPIKRKIEE